MTPQASNPDAERSADGRPADSAGVPWSGRHFEPSANADDDGSAPRALMHALERFRAGECDEADVVDAVRECRLLIPLVAQLGEADARGGLTIDKSQELSIVTVAAPDGRAVQPAFSSVDAMRAWNSGARPVPASAARVALAAAAEGTDLVVLDPGSPTEFVIRRPALWALAQSEPWMPCYRDPEVVAAVESAVLPEPAVAGVSLAAGDPRARLEGPELIVTLALQPGLDQSTLDAVMGRLAGAWSLDPIVSRRVDSLTVRLTSRF
jgi:hypothetical protein